MSLRLNSTSSIDEPDMISSDGKPFCATSISTSAIVELAVAQLLAQTLARVLRFLAHLGGIFVRRKRARRQEQIEHPFLGVLLRLGFDLVDLLVAYHLDGDFDEIADHRLHVAARRIRLP